jgi:hypothetical protein
MNKEQTFQNMIALVSTEVKKELKHLSVMDEEIGNFTGTVLLPTSEIYTPHPYSVFALCKLYEYFQRN